MPERYLSISWRHESRWGIRSGSEIIPPSIRQPKDSLTEVSGPVPRLRSQSSFTFDALFINTALPTHSLGKKNSLEWVAFLDKGQDLARARGWKWMQKNKWFQNIRISINYAGFWVVSSQDQVSGVTSAGSRNQIAFALSICFKTTE